MLGCFLKNNKEVFKAFKGHLKAKDSKKGDEKLVGKKRKAKESSSESSSSSSEEEDKKKPANKRKRSASISSRTRAHSDVKETVETVEPKKAIKPANFTYQRINEEKFREVVQN